MPATLDDPQTLHALQAASDAYERALADNDVATLDRLFHDGPEVVRFGAGECLFGAEDIAAYRRARQGGAPPRVMVRRTITAIGEDAGCVNIVFARVSDGRIGRQTQTWRRGPDGFRVIAAHVSLLDAPA